MNEQHSSPSVQSVFEIRCEFTNWRIWFVGLALFQHCAALFLLSFTGCCPA